MKMECYCFYAFLIFAVYKILDRLIRIPCVGRLNERYIFVTGCDTGFGNELAKRLDRIGCYVFAGCLTEKGETELRKACSNHLETIPLDISNKESVQKAHEFVKSKLPKGTGLWGLVNNAGIAGSVGNLEWLTVDSYMNVINVNLLGTIDVTMKFLPLVKVAGGRLVNTSSISGRLSTPNFVPYSVSKYGVEAFTDGLRRSLYAFDCKVVLIEPGGHQTNLTSRENLMRSINEVWNKASREVRDEVGEESFKSYCAARELEKSNVSERLFGVIDAYERALFGCFPRTRYMIGNDAIFFMWPLTLMPEWISDYLLIKLIEEGPNRKIQK